MKKLLITMILGVAFNFPGIVFCQCSNSGVKNASSFSNDISIGSLAFISPSNAALSDNNPSAASATVTLFAANTNYLKATGFGFSIPNSAGICGIKVEVEKSATGIGIFSSVKDNSVRLVKAGSVTGSNYANASNWSSSPNYFTYGGVTDKWGTTWTRDEINSPNFGIAFSAEINGLVSLLPSAQIDHIRMTVYFNIILPISITRFTAVPGPGHTANIEWAFAGEENNSQLNIQRRTGTGEWKTIKTYQATELIPERSINYTDNGCQDHQEYYRIQVLSANGSPSYSKIVTVSWATGNLSIYPNPASNEISISHSLNSPSVYCNGTDGSQWRLPVVMKEIKQSKVDIRHLPPGTYILNIEGKRGIFIKK
jgi:hypothetical protein